VKKAAQMRLLAATDLVSARLVRIALDDDEETSDQLRAITAILDRAGIDGKQTVTIEVKPWQEALSALSAKASSGKKRKRAKVIDGQATEQL